MTQSDGSQSYVYYLSEPKGSAFTFADFTTLKLDGSVVIEADVTVESDRLILTSSGEVEAVYAGGYLTDTTTAKPVILRAVIMVMHLLHDTDQSRVALDYTAVRQMLAPYTAALDVPGYAERPE